MPIIVYRFQSRSDEERGRRGKRRRRELGGEDGKRRRRKRDCGVCEIDIM